MKRDASVFLDDILESIAGLRDILIHSYFGVNIERAWKVVKEDIPILKKMTNKISRELET